MLRMISRHSTSKLSPQPLSFFTTTVQRCEAPVFMKNIPETAASYLARLHLKRTTKKKVHYMKSIINLRTLENSKAHPSAPGVHMYM